MGSLLVENDLCEELKLGRTPIREALQQLAHEGLIQIIPRKGIQVTSISLWEYKKLEESRAMIEQFCIPRVARIVSQLRLEELRQSLSPAPELIRKGRIAELLDIDRSFHMELVQILENPYISSMAERIYDMLSRIWYLSFKNRTEEELLHTMQGHLDILNCLERRNAAEAAKASMEHIEDCRNIIMRVHWDEA